MVTPDTEGWPAQARRGSPSAPLLKVCGATTPADIELLAQAGADLVGLWLGVPDGHAELPLPQVAALASAARATGCLQPVLVTFSADTDFLRHVVEHTGIRWLQLHAYQPPPVIKTLHAAVPGQLTIVKTLHLRGGTCVERPFTAAYERAGTDLFLLDTVTDDGRVGSTGQQLPAPDVCALVDDTTLPFLLAGGISARNRADYDSVAGHPRFRGIDVDTAARDEQAEFEAASVSDLARAWRTARHHEEVT
ncbi:hypothetical protein GCM10022402_02350 [Salinactinospora qingdaonensis]|uniref:N-(5'-phosphoribosyl)anthranilate isomerase n=2 Tax=Salinactinospora qingdaonensis TaxID=702744 RepID=A0ABP7EZS2_9ACTN